MNDCKGKVGEKQVKILARCSQNDIPTNVVTEVVKAEVISGKDSAIGNDVTVVREKDAGETHCSAMDSEVKVVETLAQGDTQEEDEITTETRVLSENRGEGRVSEGEDLDADWSKVSLSKLGCPQKISVRPGLDDSEDVSLCPPFHSAIQETG